MFLYVSTANTLRPLKHIFTATSTEVWKGIQHRKRKMPSLQCTMMVDGLLRRLGVRRRAWWLRWRHPRLTAKLGYRKQSIQEIWWLNKQSSKNIDAYEHTFKHWNICALSNLIRFSFLLGKPVISRLLGKEQTKLIRPPSLYILTFQLILFYMVETCIHY